MIVNSDKLQSIIISSKKDLRGSFLNINSVELSPQTRHTTSFQRRVSTGITMEPSVKLLSIEIDNKLNFEKHISNICKKASNQLNVICRLQLFMGHKEAMINTFERLNFNYDCLIRHVSSKNSQNKMERIHERSLKFLSNDYLNNYAELLEKSTSISVETKRLRRIVYEVFKTLNN